MFFSVSDHCDDRFVEHRTLGPFVVSTDAGWQHVRHQDIEIIWKGYADRFNLSDNLEKVSGQEQFATGNYCLLCFDPGTQKLKVLTDPWRSFPIYLDTNKVSNLLPTDRPVHTNTQITIAADFQINETKIAISNTRINRGNAATVADVDQILRDKIIAFLNHHRGPIKVFLSGGVDSLLVFSYLKNLKADYQIVWGNHLDFDDFWLKNHWDLQKNWAYRQIHHWTEPCVLSSGAPGDEFMLRSPATANLFLSGYGTSIPEQLEYHPTCLHAAYFLLPKHQEIFRQQTQHSVSQAQLKFQLINNVLNDYQHWHLGNTLTYTPLRDLDVFLTMLGLDKETAIAQVMDSRVSRELIENNVPGLTQVISDQKNTQNYMSNLTKFADRPKR